MRNPDQGQILYMHQIERLRFSMPRSVGIFDGLKSGSDSFPLQAQIRMRNRAKARLSSDFSSFSFCFPAFRRRRGRGILALIFFILILFSSSHMNFLTTSGFF